LNDVVLSFLHCLIEHRRTSVDERAISSGSSCWRAHEGKLATWRRTIIKDCNYMGSTK
jgi:hypothetical protein